MFSVSQDGFWDAEKVIAIPSKMVKNWALPEMPGEYIESCDFFIVSIILYNVPKNIKYQNLYICNVIMLILYVQD